MIGLKIMLTGALFTAASWAVARWNRGSPLKSMWYVVPVVIGFYGGIAAVFVGAVIAVWGVS